MITRLKSFYLCIAVALALAFVVAGCATSKKAARASEAQRTAENLKRMKEMLAEIQRELKSKQMAVEEIRKELRISEVPIEVANSSGGIEPETLRRLEALRVETQASYVELKTLITELQKKSRAELREVIVNAAPDALLVTLLEQLHQAEQKLDSMQKNLGTEHPEVVRTSALVKKINSQVDERLDGIMAGLEARTVSLKARLDFMVKEVDRTKQLDIEQATKARRYFEAKRELDRLQQVHDTLHRKIIQVQIDQSLPH
jgi:uncharacterized protein involved in exopolysaccharide biosynthesis